MTYVTYPFKVCISVDFTIIHKVVQASPLGDFRTFSSHGVETCCLLAIPSFPSASSAQSLITTTLSSDSLDWTILDTS